MAVPKPMQTEFRIHWRLESCAQYIIVFDSGKQFCIFMKTFQFCTIIFRCWSMDEPIVHILWGRIQTTAEWQNGRAIRTRAVSWVSEIRIKSKSEFQFWWGCNFHWDVLPLSVQLTRVSQLQTPESASKSVPGGQVKLCPVVDPSAFETHWWNLWQSDGSGFSPTDLQTLPSSDPGVDVTAGGVVVLVVKPPVMAVWEVV